MRSSEKCIFWHFIQSVIPKYLPNVFIHPFLDLEDRTITHLVIGWKCLVYSIPISIIFYYILIVFFDWYVIICGYKHINEKESFTFVIINYCISSIALYFSIRLYIKVPGNNWSLCFSCWFWSVCIPFFTIQQSLIRIYILSSVYKEYHIL